MKVILLKIKNDHFGKCRKVLKYVGGVPDWGYVFEIRGYVGNERSDISNSRNNFNNDRGACSEGGDLILKRKEQLE